MLTAAESYCKLVPFVWSEPQTPFNLRLVQMFIIRRRCQVA
ncbi:MAG: hypothetical protein ACTS6G_01440 [Candidatus Hodgkinia cicadicola]